MAAAAMAHAYPLVRGCGGEASPGPAARSQAWKLRAARRGLAARSGPETGAGDVASPPPAGSPEDTWDRRPFPGLGSPGVTSRAFILGGESELKKRFVGKEHHGRGWCEALGSPRVGRDPVAVPGAGRRPLPRLMWD